jgi:ribosome biogenesis GTPase
LSILETLGWGPFFASQLTDEERLALVPGRAVADRGRRLLVRFEDGERLASIPGRLRSTGEIPVVGDFVLAAPGEAPPMHRTLKRRSKLSRGAAGRRTSEQVLAANLDVVLIVQGLDVEVNPRRLERTLAAVYAGGAEPAIVLTKADLAPDAPAALEEARSVLPGLAVLAVSSATGEGLEDVRALLAAGRTGVFVGPSGAGKSTLVNALLGTETQVTAEVREHDRRGRHATAARQLFLIPGGGAVIDSPGIRELKLWGSAGLDEVFDDVTALAAGCRFTDCRHDDEPGCAVRAAIERGELEPDRLESLLKLEREALATAVRRDAGAAQAEKQRSRAIARARRHLQRDRGRGE